MSGIENLAPQNPEDAYPECRTAIQIEEEICRRSPNHMPRARLGIALGITLDEFIERAKLGLRKSSDMAADDSRPAVVELVRKARVAIIEMDTPQFRQYLAAKLGLV